MSQQLGSSIGVPIEERDDPSTPSIASPCSKSTSCWTFSYSDAADLPTVLARRALRLVRSLLFPKKAQAVLHKLSHGKEGESLTAVVVNDVALAVMDARLAREAATEGVQWFPTVFCLVLLNALVEYVVSRAEEDGEEGAASSAATWADVLAVHGTVTDAVSVALMCRVMQALLLNPLPAAGEQRSMVWTNSATSSFVLRGAHLMKAGVLGSHHGTSDPQAGRSLSYVATRWCPVPYAVGVLQPWQADDDKGIAVTILHAVHDALWSHFVPSFMIAMKALCPNTPNVTIFPFWFPTAMTNGREAAIVVHGPRPMVPNCSRESLASERAWTGRHGSSGDMYDEHQEFEIPPSAEDTDDENEESSYEGSFEEEDEEEISITDLEQLTSLLYDATEQGELDEEEEDEETYRALFTCSEDILIFSLCEACRKLNNVINASNPMPYHTFVAFLGKQYPRLSVTSTAYGLLRSIMTPALTSFEFKHTTYKKASDFLDAHVPFLLEVRIPSASPCSSPNYLSASHRHATTSFPLHTTSSVLAVQQGHSHRWWGRPSTDCEDCDAVVVHAASHFQILRLHPHHSSATRGIGAPADRATTTQQCCCCWWWWWSFFSCLPRWK